MAHELGSVGLLKSFRDSDKADFLRVTIAECQDTGYISFRLASGHHDDGRLLHFSPITGEIDGTSDRHIGGGEERAKFDGNNIAISCPNFNNLPIGVFTFINVAS